MAFDVTKSFENALRLRIKLFLEGIDAAYVNAPFSEETFALLNEQIQGVLSDAAPNFKVEHKRTALELVLRSILRALTVRQEWAAEAFVTSLENSRRGGKGVCPHRRRLCHGKERVARRISPFPSCRRLDGAVAVFTSSAPS